MLGKKITEKKIQTIFENFDEKPTNSFLYSLVMDPYAITYNNGSFELPLNHKVFLAAFDAIKKIANQGPCVIVGRCADYALADDKDCISIFIKSSEESRIERIMERDNVKREKAADIMRKKDKQRASYYNYYTSKKWGDSKSYNLSLDAGKLGTDNCVEMILKFRELMDAMK